MRINNMTYSILGMDYSNGDVKTTTLHECDSSIEANSWVVGYVRHDNTMGGWDSINVVAQNGFTKAEYSRDYGWTHY
jgi:hypothetical protein